MQIHSQELIELFQDYCAHHEAVYQFSPLTSQIYTFITFRNERSGVTFEEIVDTLKTSKSSVSTSLNLLISQNLIEHYNKINERKRYFRLNPNFMTERLEQIRDIIEKEHDLRLKTKALMEKGELQMYNCSGKMDLFINHLEISKEQITKTINKLKSSN